MSIYLSKKKGGERKKEGKVVETPESEVTLMAHTDIQVF